MNNTHTMNNNTRTQWITHTMNSTHTMNNTHRFPDASHGSVTSCCLLHKSTHTMNNNKHTMNNTHTMNSTHTMNNTHMHTMNNNTRTQWITHTMNNIHTHTMNNTHRFPDASHGSVNGTPIRTALKGGNIWREMDAACKRLHMILTLFVCLQTFRPFHIFFDLRKSNSSFLRVLYNVLLVLGAAIVCTV
jgi:hypothetical protein